MQKCRLSAMIVLLFGTTAPIISIANNTQETVVVTATRTAQTADESLASVTVINRKDIERQQARNVQDLLRGVPGVNIANNGGPGKATSVFMRGTNSDHVLVLIDGMRAGSAANGRTAFQNIPIDQIERIEIVRGPRSSLYGSEAIGGVIQIFTRKGSGKGLKQNFSFGGGSYGTYDGSGGISGNYKDGWFNLNASGIGTNGFNACNDSAGCGVDEPDRDGYRNVAGTARAGYRFQNGLDIEANYMRSDGKTEFDGDQNKAKIIQQVFGGKAHFSPVEMWKISLIGGVSDENSLFFENNNKDANQSRFDTRRVSASLLNNISFGNNNLSTLGFDFQNDHLKTTDKYQKTSRYNFAVFGQHQAKIASHDLQGAVRVDINEQFGTRITGGPSWGYSVTDNVRLTASFGTAFKAPTFNQLYFPPFSLDSPAFGNPDLRPEKSYSAEFGVSGKQHWGNWSLNVYETHIDNLIVGVTPPGTPIGSFDQVAQNVQKARIRGLEAVLSTQIKGWQLNGNLTFLDPENRADRDSGNRGNVLPRRAKQSFRLDANRTFLDKYVVGAMMLAEGERFNRVENVRKLDSYVKFDLRSEYIINQNWRLQGRIENLFDKQYETVSFFNQPGRNFFVTLRYQPSI